MPSHSSVTFQVLMHMGTHTNILSPQPAVHKRVCPASSTSPHATTELHFWLSEGSHSHTAAFTRLPSMINWTWLSLGDSALALCFQSHWLFFSRSVDTENINLLVSFENCSLWYYRPRTSKHWLRKQQILVSTKRRTLFQEFHMLGFGAILILNFQCLHILCFISQRLLY